MQVHSNPPDGSRGMIQILPPGRPPRSLVRPNSATARAQAPSHREVGFEQSTTFRWWDVRLKAREVREVKVLSRLTLTA